MVFSKLKGSYIPCLLGFLAAIQLSRAESAAKVFVNFSDWLFNSVCQWFPLLCGFTSDFPGCWQHHGLLVIRQSSFYWRFLSTLLHGLTFCSLNKLTLLPSFFACLVWKINFGFSRMWHCVWSLLQLFSNVANLNFIRSLWHFSSGMFSVYETQTERTHRPSVICTKHVLCWVLCFGVFPIAWLFTITLMIDFLVPVSVWRWFCFLVSSTVWPPPWPVLELPVFRVLDWWPCCWSWRRSACPPRTSVCSSLWTGCCESGVW